MKRLCDLCEGRPVFVVRHRRVWGWTRGRLKDHDLCDQCYRRVREQVVAARMLPKPWWAVRPTLDVLNHCEARLPMRSSA